jgi:hypothetical protein
MKLIHKSMPRAEERDQFQNQFWVTIWHSLHRFHRFPWSWSNLFRFTSDAPLDRVTSVLILSFLYWTKWTLMLDGGKSGNSTTCGIFNISHLILVLWRCVKYSCATCACTQFSQNRCQPDCKHGYGLYRRKSEKCNNMFKEIFSRFYNMLQLNFTS